MTEMNVTSLDESGVVKLLQEQLQSLEGTKPEDYQARVLIAERIRQFEREDREFHLKVLEQRSSTQQWRSNTPLVIALTGALTIAANFGVSYILKNQGSEQERQLAETNSRLTNQNQQLNSQLRDSEAARAQARANETRGIEFQYTMIDKIMSAAPDPDIKDEEVQAIRARQIAFLYKMGLMDQIEGKGFAQLYKKLTKEDLDDAEIGFPTLPTSEAKPAIIGSQWSKASIADMTRILGPRGTADCPVPLADLEVPFEMVAAFDEDRRITKFQVHEAAAPYFLRAFQLIADRKLEREARLFGGVYAPRNIRGTKKPSVHAWGTAIDIDPANNRLDWGRDKAKLSTEFARTMEEAGFLSSGLMFDREWSHFELSLESLLKIESDGYKPTIRNCKSAASDSDDMPGAEIKSDVE